MYLICIRPFIFFGLFCHFLTSFLIYELFCSITLYLLSRNNLMLTRSLSHTYAQQVLLIYDTCILTAFKKFFELIIFMYYRMSTYYCCVCTKLYYPLQDLIPLDVSNANCNFCKFTYLLISACQQIFCFSIEHTYFIYHNHCLNLSTESKMLANPVKKLEN